MIWVFTLAMAALGFASATIAMALKRNSARLAHR